MVRKEIVISYFDGKKRVREVRKAREIKVIRK